MLFDELKPLRLAAQKGKVQAIGRSRDRGTMKIHALVDEEGRLHAQMADIKAGSLLSSTSALAVRRGPRHPDRQFAGAAHTLASSWGYRHPPRWQGHAGDRLKAQPTLVACELSGFIQSINRVSSSQVKRA
jgi:hypothetical protein